MRPAISQAPHNSAIDSRRQRHAWSPDAAASAPGATGDAWAPASSSKRAVNGYPGLDAAELVERPVERPEVPEILGLQRRRVALELTGHAVEAEVVLHRGLAAAVVWEGARGHRFLVVGDDFRLQVGGKIRQQIVLLAQVRNGRGICI